MEGSPVNMAIHLPFYFSGSNAIMANTRTFSIVATRLDNEFTTRSNYGLFLFAIFAQAFFQLD